MEANNAFKQRRHVTGRSGTEGRASLKNPGKLLRSIRTLRPCVKHSLESLFPRSLQRSKRLLGKERSYHISMLWVWGGCRGALRKRKCPTQSSMHPQPQGIWATTARPSGVLINEPVEDSAQLPQTVEIIHSDGACWCGMTAKLWFLQPQCSFSLH